MDLHSIHISQRSPSHSALAFVIGIAGEAKLADHQVWEAQRHEAVDLYQPVQTEGSLKEVFRTMPHTLVPTAGILLQVAEVHRFDEDTRGSVGTAGGRGLSPQIQCYGKVQGNVVTILRFIHQGMHCLRLVLEELQVAAMEKGGTY